MSPLLIAQMRRMTGNASEVREVRDGNSASEELTRIADACLIVTVPGERQTVEMNDIARLRKLHPHVSAVAIYVPSESSYKGALQLGAAGITEIVTTQPVFDEKDFLAALSHCHADGVAVRIWRLTNPELPDALVPLLKAALRLAHEPVSTTRLASAAGMHERTLRKYCEHEKLPSPQWIIGWARLLIAAFYLEEPGRTIGNVADILDYPSASALRNQIRRYTNAPPSAVRGQSMATSFCRLLEMTIREHERTINLDQQPRPRLSLIKP
ncbi:MAG: AraC family transcriptional regulator [Gemmatimonadaceae bacterium]